MYAGNSTAKGKTITCIKRYVVAQHEQVEKLALSYGYEIIHNKHPEKGISHSIVLAVNSCKEDDGILFMVADQPLLKETTLQNILEKADEKHIVCVGNHDNFQNPMLFPKGTMRNYYSCREIKVQKNCLCT